MFYSDGVTESLNLSDELFGATRLFETLRDSARQPLGKALSEVVSQVAAWRGAAPIHDDLSLLALEYAPRQPLVEPTLARRASEGQRPLSLAEAF